jgi:hypothetical protein
MTADCLITWMWTGRTAEQRLVAVNYAGNQSQCYVRLPAPGARAMRFTDLMDSSTFERDGRDLDAHGLYLDMPPWGYHVFELTAV